MDMITVLEHRGATDINQKRGIFVRLDNERKRYVKISELQAGFPRAIGIEFQHENGVWSPLTPDYLNDQAFIFLPGDQSQYAVISSGEFGSVILIVSINYLTTYNFNLFQI